MVPCRRHKAPRPRCNEAARRPGLAWSLPQSATDDACASSTERTFRASSSKVYGCAAPRTRCCRSCGRFLCRHSRWSATRADPGAAAAFACPATGNSVCSPTAAYCQNAASALSRRHRLRLWMRQHRAGLRYLGASSRPMFFPVGRQRSLNLLSNQLCQTSIHPDAPQRCLKTRCLVMP
jgi:hypothetical protein